MTQSAISEPEFRGGMDAFIKGVYLKDNPFSPATNIAEFSLWRAGWKHAKREKMKIKLK